MKVIGTQQAISLLYESIHKAGLDDVVANDIDRLKAAFFTNNISSVFSIQLNNDISVGVYTNINETDTSYYEFCKNVTQKLLDESNKDILLNASELSYKDFGMVSSDKILIAAKKDIDSWFDDEQFNNIECLFDNSCSFISSAIVRLPTNIKCIDESAFQNNDNVMSVLSETSNAFVVKEYAFDNSHLEYIDLKSCSSIENNAFSNCSCLTSISFGESLLTFGPHVFENCISLQHIDLNSTKISCIEDFAFGFCSSLTSISLPSTMLSIDDFAFYGCANLSSFDFTYTQPMKFRQQIFYSCPHTYIICVDNEDYDKWIELNNDVLYDLTNLSSHFVAQSN